MTTLSSELNMDDLAMANLPSGELEKLIQQNFSMMDDPPGGSMSYDEQGSSQILHSGNPSSVMSRSGRSPMLSSAALAGSTADHIKSQQSNQPWVEITEQPKARGLRFRYECEGRSAGSIPGETSTAERKKFPSIKIHNYVGPAIVVVSCVTKDQQPSCKPHPHSLVGKECKKGVCTVKIKDTNVISFPNLGIQCAKKKDVENSLKQRKEINVDPFQTGFSHAGGNIDLNVVRLCFQVFLPDASGKITRVVPPVVSHLIHDKKSVNELVICRVDRSSGKARGGDELFLLCEKVNKDDIQVRFFEDGGDGTVWEEFGDFGQGDVHRQYAIVFKTPAYRESFISRPVDVFMQLRRPSDQETSEPIPFTYMPEDPDPDRIEEKRKRKSVNWNPAGAVGDGRGQNAHVKESLRTKLKANRRIKQEGDLGQQGNLPMYSLANISGPQPMSSGAAATAAGTPTMSYRTADNTGIGSMTISQPAASTVSSLQFQNIKVDQLQTTMLTSTPHVGQSGLPSGGNPGLNAGFTAETIDLQMLQAYLQDNGQGQGDVLSFGETYDGLSGDLIGTGYDPNVAAMESVTSDDGNLATNTQNITSTDLLRALHDTT